MTREYRRDSSFSFIVIVVATLILAVAFAARAQDAGSLFLPAVTYNTGGRDYVFYGNSDWVSINDVNGDGKVDVVIANWCLRASRRSVSLRWQCGRSARPRRWNILASCELRIGWVLFIPPVCLGCEPRPETRYSRGEWLPRRLLCYLSQQWIHRCNAGQRRWNISNIKDL